MPAFRQKAFIRLRRIPFPNLLHEIRARHRCMRFAFEPVPLLLLYPQSLGAGMSGPVRASLTAAQVRMWLFFQWNLHVRSGGAGVSGVLHRSGGLASGTDRVAAVRANRFFGSVFESLLSQADCRNLFSPIPVPARVGEVFPSTGPEDPISGIHEGGRGSPLLPCRAEADPVFSVRTPALNTPASGAVEVFHAFLTPFLSLRTVPFSGKARKAFRIPRVSFHAERCIRFAGYPSLAFIVNHYMRRHPDRKSGLFSPWAFRKPVVKTEAFPGHLYPFGPVFPENRFLASHVHLTGTSFARSPTFPGLGLLSSRHAAQPYATLHHSAENQLLAVLNGEGAGKRDSVLHFLFSSLHTRAEPAPSQRRDRNAAVRSRIGSPPPFHGAVPRLENGKDRWHAVSPLFRQPEVRSVVNPAVQAEAAAASQPRKHFGEIGDQPASSVLRVRNDRSFPPVPPFAFGSAYAFLSTEIGTSRNLTAQGSPAGSLWGGRTVSRFLTTGRTITIQRAASVPDVLQGRNEIIFARRGFHPESDTSGSPAQKASLPERLAEPVALQAVHDGTPVSLPVYPGSRSESARTGENAYSETILSSRPETRFRSTGLHAPSLFGSATRFFSRSMIRFTPMCNAPFSFRGNSVSARYAFFTQSESRPGSSFREILNSSTVFLRSSTQYRMKTIGVPGLWQKSGSADVSGASGLYERAFVNTPANGLHSGNPERIQGPARYSRLLRFIRNNLIPVPLKEASLPMHKAQRSVRCDPNKSADILQQASPSVFSRNVGDRTLLQNTRIIAYSRPSSGAFLARSYLFLSTAVRSAGRDVLCWSDSRQGVLSRLLTTGQVPEADVAGAQSRGALGTTGFTALRKPPLSLISRGAFEPGVGLSVKASGRPSVDAIRPLPESGGVSPFRLSSTGSFSYLLRASASRSPFRRPFLHQPSLTVRDNRRIRGGTALRSEASALRATSRPGYVHGSELVPGRLVRRDVRISAGYDGWQGQKRRISGTLLSRHSSLSFLSDSTRPASGVRAPIPERPTPLLTPPRVVVSREGRSTFQPGTPESLVYLVPPRKTETISSMQQAQGETIPEGRSLGLESMGRSNSPFRPRTDSISSDPEAVAVKVVEKLNSFLGRRELDRIADLLMERFIRYGRIERERTGVR